MYIAVFGMLKAHTGADIEVWQVISQNPNDGYYEVVGLWFFFFSFSKFSICKKGCPHGKKYMDFFFFLSKETVAWGENVCWSDPSVVTFCEPLNLGQLSPGSCRRL